MNEVPAFALKSWGDVFALLSVSGMLLAGIIWGLKLEFDVRDIRRRIRDIEDNHKRKHRLLENGDD